MLQVTFHTFGADSRCAVSCSILILGSIALSRAARKAGGRHSYFRDAPESVRGKTVEAEDNAITIRMRGNQAATRLGRRLRTNQTVTPTNGQRAMIQNAWE
jgi:hypothetical protein